MKKTGFFRFLGLTALVVAATMLFSPRAYALVGDLNGDDQVNVGDVSVLYSGILAGTTDSLYDLNGDGFVNTGDVSLLYYYILHGQPEEPVADVYILGSFGDQTWAPNVGTLMTYDENNKVYTAEMSGEGDIFLTAPTPAPSWVS